MSDWRIFKGDHEIRDQVILPPAPPWRDFQRAAEHRAMTFQIGDEEIQLINAAIYLRRPLLITGAPGSGKSSLPYPLAYELGLGSVLRWSINSRSTLTEGLYHYDAIARLRDVSLSHSTVPQIQTQSNSQVVEGDVQHNIGDYLTLGPLGTALLPCDRPRVLLIDELDKSDIDLPNDLLHVLEEGCFEIPELLRIANKQPEVWLQPSGGSKDSDRVCIRGGVVQCREFPLVVITSNGECEMPAPFLRRCLRLRMPEPDAEKLSRIVQAHLGDVDAGAAGVLIQEFIEAREKGRLVATDQLLNAVFLVTNQRAPSDQEWGSVRQVLLQALNEG
ncbi:MAG: MoxR family ATPase [Deltaproteobacteria bacterium]|nr:MoxR family ATPase [Deltaproteobacteria bacterium]